MDLGATPLKVFFVITVPMIAPAIVIDATPHGGKNRHRQGGRARAGYKAGNHQIVERQRRKSTRSPH
jgi:hypothetical protein